MKKNITILLVIFLTAYSFSQSAHQYFYNKSKKEPKIKPRKISVIKRDSTTQQNNLSKAVFGFLPDWEYNSDSKNYLRFDLLSHIGIFGFVADSSGNLTNPDSWVWNDLIDVAHSFGVKVIMTVISFDNETTHILLTDNNAKINLFNNIAGIISNSNLDGVNLDFEGLFVEDRGSRLNTFVDELKNYLNPSLEVSFDAPAWNWGGWDFSGLADACDYLFVMEYDYFGSWSETVGPSAPLTGNGINITRSITEQFASVPGDKLILGVPYYGIFWTTKSDDENSETSDFNDYLTYSTIKSGFDWNTERWSENYSVPWYMWQEDSTRQIWFDNVESLEEKYDFAISQNLKGIGIWALGFDGNRKELWSLIDKKFNNSPNTLPEPPVAFSVKGIKENNQVYSVLNFSKCKNATGYRIYFSDNGIDFNDSSETNDTLVFIARNDISDGVLNSKYFKVAAINDVGISATTNVLASNSFEGNSANSLYFLVVDGFDRYYGNNNNFDYVTKIADIFDELGIAFNSCNNEAVITNKIEPTPNIYWILGNESRLTETFNFFEQNFLAEVIANNNSPNIFVSGSEIGYDLGNIEFSRDFDELFYSDILKAEFIADYPGNAPFAHYNVENISGTTIEFIDNFSFDNGMHGTFDVGYPDVISSIINSNFNDLKYSNTQNDFAGISYEGDYRLVYLAFPIETVFDSSQRASVISSAMNFFKYGSSSTENEILPKQFYLSQNYPNPFNPITVIEYAVPTNSFVKISVYDILGRVVKTLVNAYTKAGYHKIKFDGKHLSSGVYFYSLEANNYRITKKMLLLK